MSDYDLAVIGGGFAGATAALSLLKTADNAGRVVLIESRDPGRWPDAWRWARPFLRLGRDNKPSREWVDRMEEASEGRRIWTTAAS